MNNDVDGPAKGRQDVLSHGVAESRPVMSKSKRNSFFGDKYIDRDIILHPVSMSVDQEMGTISPGTYLCWVQFTHDPETYIPISLSAEYILP